RVSAGPATIRLHGEVALTPRNAGALSLSDLTSNSIDQLFTLNASAGLVDATGAPLTAPLSIQLDASLGPIHLRGSLDMTSGNFFAGGGISFGVTGNGLKNFTDL